MVGMLKRLIIMKVMNFNNFLQSNHTLYYKNKINGGKMKKYLLVYDPANARRY
jgi:hypothetical protein